MNATPTRALIGFFSLFVYSGYISFPLWVIGFFWPPALTIAVIVLLAPLWLMAGALVIMAITGAAWTIRKALYPIAWVGKRLHVDGEPGALAYLIAVIVMVAPMVYAGITG